MKRHLMQLTLFFVALVLSYAGRADACFICPTPGAKQGGGLMAMALLVGAGLIFLIRGLKK